ncbi:MAG: DNA primase [Candidatus Roizmanbacteria bacterium]|nr:MAG: DNA primase [Candidatus Roizmanbacteria bacterium]
MEPQIEEIKKRIDIIEFLGNYISLKRTGRNFKGLCPFHNEKTASFVVSPERQIWHCFGSCGIGGDVISFLMKWENITFSEALTELAEKTGIKLKRVQFEDKEWQIKQRMIQLNSLTCDYFEYLLNNTDLGKRTREYLDLRKTDSKIAKKFHLGYAPSSWDSLLTFLKKKKYTVEEIYKAGLIVKNSKGNYYDRFRGRVMFPIRDARGNVIGFSGRLLDSDIKEAKYINTPETLLYHKRETLYGIDLAKEAIKKKENALLVEGEFDVISLHQYGIENAVAIKGSAVTKEQLLLLKRYTPRIILSLDADSAGEEAIKRGIEEGEDTELDISVVHFEGGKDPDEAVHTDLQAFKKNLEKTIPIFDFLINFFQKKYPDNTPFSKKKIGEEIIPFLSKVKNPIIQSYYMKRLAEILQVSEESISETLKKEKFRKKTKFLYIKKQNENIFDRVDILQKYLVSVMLQSDNAYDISEKIFTVLTPNDFIIRSLKKICEAFLKFKKTHSQKFDFNLFIHDLPQELRAMGEEVYLIGSSEWGFNMIKIDRLILEVKRYILKKRISELLEIENNSEKEKELLLAATALKEVEKKLSLG